LTRCLPGHRVSKHHDDGLRCCCCGGGIYAARHLFDGMLVRNVMIKCYLREGKAARAGAVRGRWMTSSGVRVTAMTMVGVATASAWQPR
jgi:hypothetical protein